MCKLTFPVGCFTWNVSGAGQAERKRRISYYCKEQQVHFAIIMSSLIVIITIIIIMMVIIMMVIIMMVRLMDQVSDFAIPWVYNN